MANNIHDRDNIILRAAIELAKEDSYQWVTRDAVAAKAGVAAGTINTAFGNMAELKRAVIRHAIEHRILPIVAEAIGARHPIALDSCPEDLRKEALHFALQG